ncbi:MAG: NUDIX domain-containing protein [Gammaproteobacteria bacterium]|jgi:8-oxo-dGTP diphosphatase|nr:NUDIX domain-containing protein [Gammaproteobacteria bacterium]
MSIDIECSVAIIRNNNGYLFSQRLKKPFLNYFEFPGGKVENNETPEECLIRECYEELDIKIKKTKYYGHIIHLYGELSVRLHIFDIIDFNGNIKSNEKQNLKYIDYFRSSELFLESTSRVLNRITLKELLFITPQKYTSFLKNVSYFKNNNSFIRLRSFDYTYSQYILAAKSISNLCNITKTPLVIDKKYSEKLKDLDYNGIHYTSEDLNNIRMHQYIRKKGLTYSASCHNLDDILIANQYNFDFILLSPVITSKYNYKTHGWENFMRLVINANMPVFALGGIKKNDLKICKSNGGFGISGIDDFWL